MYPKYSRIQRTQTGRIWRYFLYFLWPLSAFFLFFCYFVNNATFTLSLRSSISTICPSDTNQTHSRIHNSKRWYIYIFHCQFPCIWRPYALTWALCTMQIQDDEGEKNPGDKGVAFFLLRGKIKICWKSADYIFRSIIRWQLAVSVCSFPANLLLFCCFVFFFRRFENGQIEKWGKRQKISSSLSDFDLMRNHVEKGEQAQRAKQFMQKRRRRQIRYKERRKEEKSTFSFPQV